MVEVGQRREALLVGLEATDEGALVPCLETLGFRCRHAARDASLGHACFDVAFLDAGRIAPIPDSPSIVWITDPTTSEAREPSSSEWIDRPIRPRVVRAVVERVLARRELEQRATELTRRHELDLPAPTIIAESGPMSRLITRVEQWARDRRPVMLRGAHGVGRGLIARQIAGLVRLGTHELRGERLSRHDGADELLRGLDAVGRGTLVVRDIDEAGEDVQLALAHQLQDGARAKVVVSTAPAKRLRRELRHLLHDRELVVPSLHERTGDLQPLARHFLSHYAPRARFTRDALAALASYAWPGEVAELRNVVESCTLRSRGEIDARHLPERVLASAAGARYVGGDFTLAEIEWAHLSALLATGRPLQDIARVLGIDGSTLWRIRKRHAHG
jgi:NtrC-family two-component system response regulator AlgB